MHLTGVTEEWDLHWNGEPPRAYEITIRGEKLDAKDISKVNSSHSFLLFKTAQVSFLNAHWRCVVKWALDTFLHKTGQGIVHRTEVVKGTLQPHWKPIVLELDCV